jgi:hypothetical protein
MNLGGNLENEGTQCWWVNDTGGPDSFKARMEDFVVQGGEWPFDDAIVVHSGSEFFLDDKSWEIARPTDGNCIDPAGDYESATLNLTGSIVLNKRSISKKNN